MKITPKLAKVLLEHIKSGTEMQDFYRSFGDLTYTQLQELAEPKLEINGVRVSAPATEELELSTNYFLLSLCTPKGYTDYIWEDGDADKGWLKAGVIWTSEEDIQKVVAAYRSCLQGV